MFVGLHNDASPKLRDEERIREARELFLELNSHSGWSQAEVKRRRFTEAELGHMRCEKVDWDRAERRFEAQRQ